MRYGVAAGVAWALETVVLGVAKAMALNVTYTAWAMLFGVVLLRDTSNLSPLTVGCALVVLVCGICAATDFKKLFGKKSTLK